MHPIWVKDQQILISELQSLVIESKRRNPEVRDAGENALELLKGSFPANLTEEQRDSLLSPITLGCKTKNAKIVGISISALQRLVALGGVPSKSLPGVLQTLTTVSNQGVDIQLKILQTLLSILTCCKDVHGEQLGDVLLLYFKLQDSRVSVVSSTAAATLRQAVMLVFNRVATDTIAPSIPLSLHTDPPTEITLTPSAMDAFNIFSDLCLLTSSSGGGSGLSLWGSSEKEKPKLLKLSSLQKTFGLELIESILSGFEEGVKQRPELLFLLRHSLDPLLLKLQGEKPTFPIALRVCRLIFLLVRSFADQMPLEVETYLISLIRLGMGDGDDEAKKEHVAPWLRVLALEILRAICGDSPLLQKIWMHYDQPDGPNLCSKLVTALSRLVNEKPALLGDCQQMHGLGVPSGEGNSNAGYLDMGIGMVASAASAGVSTVSAMMGSGGGLGSHSATKLRLIEQHDKAEPPVFPETYIYLLALQSLDAVAEGIYHSVSQPATHGMAESAWPALLAALSYCIGTNLSDPLFAEVLSALQDFTIACGLLNLETPRDAFLNTLGKYAVPPPVVSAMQAYAEQPAPRNNSVISADALGLTALAGGSTNPPSLSERNLACLKSAVTTAQILAGSLGEAWHDVLEALQNANYILSPRKPSMGRRPTAPMASPAKTRPSIDFSDTRAAVFNDIDVESISLAINGLFDCSKDMDDIAFTTFIKALCQLSSEMIGVDVNVSLSGPTSPMTPAFTLSPNPMDLTRRRTSGINVSQSIKSTERSFGLSKLRVVSNLNLSRLVNKDASVGWTTITQHLLSVARHPSAPSAIRMDASDALGDLLLGAIRIGQDSRIQHQVFDVLIRQVDVHPISNIVATDFDIRSAGFKTLNQILESSGHSLEVGWGTIFDMLSSVCKHDTRSNGNPSDAAPNRPTTLFSKGDANLVRIAFPSLTIICTDFLTSLDSNDMRQCITCLGHFGQQREDVNITLAAIGLLWNVSDAVQGESNEQWLYLLKELLELGRDTRLEVRSSAMQTLFRCVELYGANLPNDLWEDVLWTVIFPLFDATPGDESQVLALSSVGGIFGAFLNQLSELPSFDRLYQHFLDGIKRSFSSDPPQCCTAALKALVKVLSAVTPGHSLVNLDATWMTFTEMDAGLASSQSYTQDNLVALVRVASLLHGLIDWNPERVRGFSTILRNVLTYSKSPEYRPDVDTMSPLQSAIAEMVAGSKSLPRSVVLSDLADYASLAYLGDPSSKVSYVALSKFALPKMATLFSKSPKELNIYEDGTLGSVLNAYSIPIKLRYDCPAASRYGEDPPLWKTAMSNFLVVLKAGIPAFDGEAISIESFNAIWSQILDIFSGVLLADTTGASDDDEQFVLPILETLKAVVIPRLTDHRLPESTITSFAENLRKASVLYHYDVTHPGGTTATVIAESQESLRYWALEVMIACVDRKRVKVGNGFQGNHDQKQAVLAGLMLPSVIKRFEDSMRCFVDDARLRGQMPFARIREDELLYTLRQLATLQLWEGTMSPSKSLPEGMASIYKTSHRAHLFHFYTLLLELSFLHTHLPSLYLFPSENEQLFGLNNRSANLTNGDGSDEEKGEGAEVVDAGDGGDLIEVNAISIAKLCLEHIGREVGLE